MLNHELLLPNGVAVPVGEAPLGIGRAPANDVVLADDSVSWHHAQVWSEGEAAWVRDLGSRNGTFVNGARAVSAVRLADGDQVRIGATAILRLCGGPRQVPRWRIRHVEDLSTGVRVMVRRSRFALGSAAGSDLRLDEWPALAATLLVHDNGELWLVTAEGEREIAADEVFELDGRLLRIVERDTEHAPTADTGAEAPLYRLVASGQGVDGPAVSVVEPGTQRETRFTGNRGVLLYALARQWVRDREEGLGVTEIGWCRTDDLLVAVWGRGAKDSNHLNVLLHRLRGQLEQDALDPFFIEKRRGAMRVRVADVVLR